MSSPKMPFHLYKRPLKKSTIYYARYLLPDGNYTAGRSTGETSKTRAESRAWEYLQTGDVTLQHRKKLADFGRKFFNWDGEWALSKRSAGLRCSPEQCKCNQSVADHHVFRFLGNRLLTDIDTATVKRFRNDMYKEGYAGSTINKALGCLRAILEAAEEAHLLRALPRVQRAGLNQKERGILTQNEVERLFDLEWDDYRSYVANIVAASTGFRLGEILGIRRANISSNKIEITGSWSSRSRKFKPGTKNGQPTRSVPIPDAVGAVLHELVNMSPWKSPQSYVFYTERSADKPMEHIRVTRAFVKMLSRLDPPIDDEERIRRRITFHSHRHFFNSLLVESRIPLQKIQRLTGHLSDEMTQRYYHMDDLSDVADVQTQVFDFLAFQQRA